MVDEVNENLGVFVGLEGGAVRVVTEEDVEEVLLVDSGAGVVDLVCDVDVGGIDVSLCGGGQRLVEELAWVWVL